MRLDSCRNCGFTLDVKKSCNTCNQPLQFQCKHCMKFAEDPIHTNCIIQASGLLSSKSQC